MTKIRILQVIPSLETSGISSVVMNWYRALDKSQMQFDFISFNEGPLAEEIERLGGRVFLLPTFKQGPLQYLKCVHQVLNNGTKYRAIHVHNSFKNFVMLWQAKLAHVPIRVCHSHTAGLEARWLRPYFSLIKAVTRGASNCYVACGQEAGKFLFGERDFKLLNNAIDVSQYALDDFSESKRAAVCEKYLLPQDKYLVAHVGRFSEVKNHQFLLELAKSGQLAKRLHFVCIGDGPLRAAFRDKIEFEHLNDRFSLVPENNEISQLLNVVDAFIMPSLFEGVSVALLEAQASNLPCFVSDSVAKEVDMGLGNLEFLSLSKPSTWIAHLNHMRPKGDNIDILSGFTRHGYSIQAVLEKLNGIYQRQ